MSPQLKLWLHPLYECQNEFHLYSFLNGLHADFELVPIPQLHHHYYHIHATLLCICCTDDFIWFDMEAFINQVPSHSNISFYSALFLYTPNFRNHETKLLIFRAKIPKRAKYNFFHPRLKKKAHHNGFWEFNGKVATF